MDDSGAMGAAAEGIAAGAPREDGARDADGAPDTEPEVVRRLILGAVAAIAKLFPKTLDRFIPLVGPIVEAGMAGWRYYSMRRMEKEAKEAMQRAARRWADHIEESADRLNDEAKEIVRRSVDDAFAPAEARLHAAREGLKEEARAMAEDRAILNVCRERVKRHLEAMLPVPPAA